ncbi:MAG: DUF5930 domain-containing protein [Pseudomonadota bacterium]
MSGFANDRFGRVFPERRLIIRSETSTRYLRLSPVGQAGGVALAALLCAWTAFSALTLAETNLRAASAQAQLSDARASYENRIAALHAQTRRLAEDLSVADHKAGFALETLSDQHLELSSALTNRDELSVALQSHKSRLASLVEEHDATVKICEETTQIIAALETRLAEIEGRNETLSGALAALNHTLYDVAAERDSASEATEALTLQLDELNEELAAGGARRSHLFAQLEDAAALSLGSLEGVFENSGVKLDPILSAVRKEYDGEGGPFFAADEIAADNGEDAVRLAKLMTDLERVNLLRIATAKMPFARPAHGARFTSGFGPRRDPKNGRRALHTGMDFAGPRGTPILATGAGEVVKAGWMRGYGKIVRIRHAFGYETIYAHLHKIRVKVGDQVERGARIGDMGSTGRSTGTHLHYEVRIGGTAVNPAKFIEAARYVL